MEGEEWVLPGLCSPSSPPTPLSALELHGPLLSPYWFCFKVIPDELLFFTAVTDRVQWFTSPATHLQSRAGW